MSRIRIFFILLFLFYINLFLFAEAEIDNNKGFQLNDVAKSKLDMEKHENCVKFSIKYSDLFTGEDFEKK